MYKSRLVQQSSGKEAPAFTDAGSVVQLSSCIGNTTRKMPLFPMRVVGVDVVYFIHSI